MPLFTTVLSLRVVALLAGSVALCTGIRSVEPDQAPATPAASNITPSATDTPVPPAVQDAVGLLVDVTTGRITGLWGQNEFGCCLTFSADGRWMAFAAGTDSSHQEIRVLDLASPSLLSQPIADGLAPHLSPDNPLVAFATSAPVGRIEVRHLTTPGTVSLEPAGQQPRWSPDGRWLTFWSLFGPPPDDRTLYLVDRHGWSVRTVGTAYLCQCDAPYGPFWSPDGRWFYYPYASDRQAALIDPATLARTPVAGYPHWAPTGSQFITLDEESMTLHSGPSDAGSPLVTGQRGVHRPLWSPDGTMLTYEGADAGVTAISIPSGRPLWRAPGVSVGWSANGEFFAAAEKGARIEGGRLNVMRSADGSLLHELDNVLNPAWSPNEPVLAFTRVDTGACNRPNNPVKLSLHLFDARTAEERLVLQSIESICRGSRPLIAWAPDGRHLALCGSCGSL